WGKVLAERLRFYHLLKKDEDSRSIADEAARVIRFALEEQWEEVWRRLIADAARLLNQLDVKAMEPNEVIWTVLMHVVVDAGAGKGLYNKAVRELVKGGWLDPDRTPPRRGGTYRLRPDLYERGGNTQPEARAVGAGQST